MLLIVLAVGFVLLVPVLGGDLRGLGRIELRHPGAALAGLGLQVLVTSVIPAPTTRSCRPCTWRPTGSPGGSWSSTRRCPASCPWPRAAR
jgi:hypothetical protein